MSIYYLVFIIGAQSDSRQCFAFDFGVQTNSLYTVIALQHKLHGKGDVRQDRRVFRHI